MASDQRWTGGAANRGWQSGTRATPVADREAVLVQVRRYLADCRRHQSLLSPQHHPSEGSAVQVVFGPKDIIRAAYRHLTSPRPVTAVPLA